MIVRVDLCNITRPEGKRFGTPTSLVKLQIGRHFQVLDTTTQESVWLESILFVACQEW